jgi:hypothetical protein
MVDTVVTVDTPQGGIYAGLNNDGLEAQPGTSSGFSVRAGTQVLVDPQNQTTTYAAYWEIRSITGGKKNSSGVWITSSTRVDGGIIYVVHPGDAVGVTVWFSGTTVYFDFSEDTQNTGTIRAAKNLTSYPGFTWSTYSIHSTDCRITRWTSYLAKWTGTLSITNCQVMFGGVWHPMTATSYHAVNLTNITGSPLTSLSGLDTSTHKNFTVSWIKGA